MKILLDFTTRSEGGGKTFSFHFLHNLAKIDVKNFYFLFVSSPLPYDLPANFKINTITSELPYELWKVFWYERTIKEVIAKEKIDLFYGPAGISPFRLKCPIIITLQNLWPFYPDQLPFVLNLKKLLRRWYINKSVNYATLIHFPSYSSLQDHVRLGLDIDPSKARIIYWGIGDHFLAYRNDRPLNNVFNNVTITELPYILFVGNIFRHKNLTTLIKAFARIVQEGKRHINLIIVGKVMEPDYYEEISNLIKILGITSHVRFVGEVAYNDLPTFYRCAQLFVFPSLLETFGFPLIEAMASKVPLVVSDIAVSREICGDASLFFMPDDDAALASLITKILLEDKLRDVMVEKGFARAKSFTWEHMAKKMVLLFEETLSRGQL